MSRILTALATLALATPALAAEPVLAPGEIVAAAPKADWVAIAASDLLVMDLAPPAQGPGQASAKGKPRRVVIQLMPHPFSQGWIGNIRKLAAAHWWDGLSVNRVQDNYVVQWGDADGEDKAKAKKLPAELYNNDGNPYTERAAANPGCYKDFCFQDVPPSRWFRKGAMPDVFSSGSGFHSGWPLAHGPRRNGSYETWPVHCYGMVGVGRDMPPNTGSGAELYVVIGHAPRHLDRNIALVGRVIEGIEHLSSLPRGTGALGFYETPEERTGIVSVRLLSELEVDPVPRFEYLSTDSETFARYADARANRRDAFFIRPAGGADVCNIPVPVRRVAAK